MRLAILGTRGIPASYGGFETFAEQVAVRLAERGHQVTVYCVFDDTKQPESFKGIKLTYLSSPRLGPLTTIIFDLRCLWHARNRYDVVYMLGYGAGIFCFIPRMWGTKVWINMDGIEWARAKWGRIAKTYFKIMEFIAMRTASRIIADADGISHFLYSRHPVATPCSVIPYGAPVVELAPSTAFLDERGLQKDAYYLVVCRLEPENHIRDILSGFIASASKSPLVLIGDYTMRTDYVRQLRDVHNDRIRFLGTVYNPDNLQSLRYYCKAYFHGHSVGGTNPSLLEALGCGNIVIAHDNVFNREVAAEAGIYFRAAEDIPGLVREVESVDGRRRSQWADRARKRIINYYNWDAVTKKYFDLLQSDSTAPGAQGVPEQER